MLFFPIIYFSNYSLSIINSSMSAAMRELYVKSYYSNSKVYKAYELSI